MATNNSIPPIGDQFIAFPKLILPVVTQFDASAIDQWPTIPGQAILCSSGTNTQPDEQPTMPEQAVQKSNTPVGPIHWAPTDLVTQPTGVIRAPTGTRIVPTGAIKSAPTTTSDERDTKSVIPHVPTTPIIAVRGLTKTYFLGQTQVRALRGVSLEVHPGEFVAIMGPSGSGKSTFMNLIGCLDRPTEGEYWLAGKLVSSMSSDELADMRNRLLGFVFQGFNLLGRATALANAALPLVYAGLSKGARTRRARAVLKVVGLGSRMHHKPAQLSGGQQQRVAIARALVNGPALLLADEPTGNLDSRTSLEVIAVLQALNQQGLTIVMVTHDADVAAFTKRQVGFLDGRIVRDERVLAPRSAQKEWTALVETKPRKGVIDQVVGAQLIAPVDQVHIKEEPT